MSITKNTVLTELVEYEAKLIGIENRFDPMSGAIWIGEGDAENLLQYVRELIDLLYSALGKPNQYSQKISDYYNEGLRNVYGSPSLLSVRNITYMVKAARTFIEIPSSGLVQLRNSGVHVAMVAESRLEELRFLASVRFDFAKLTRLCEELNTAYMNECYYASAMLIRAVLDHVPPVFGMASFTEVANNYAHGGSSFKETMHGLETAAKKISDRYLHLHIQEKESLPTAQQVRFAGPLDALLGEIVRVTM
jgi:hypothetical protein